MVPTLTAGLTEAQFLSLFLCISFRCFELENITYQPIVAVACDDSVCEEVCKEQPEDPIEFLAQYLLLSCMEGEQLTRLVYGLMEKHQHNICQYYIS